MAFFVYRASAGSGKTYTLVRTYLALAMSGDDPANFRHILAITFTNKAAQEMKTRIIAALAALSGREDDARYKTMGEELGAQLGLSPENLRFRANSVFESVLHRYQEFSISTIDAFVAKIGRSFARDLRLQQSFEILLDQNEIKEEAVDWLFSRLGEDGSLTETLVDFAIEQTREDKSWDIRRSLLQYCQELFRDESRVYLPLLAQMDNMQLRQGRQYIQQQIAVYGNKIRTIAQEVVSEITASGLTDSVFAGGSRGLAPFFRKTAEGDFDGLSKTALNALEDDKWLGSKLSISEKTEAEHLIPALRKGLLQLQEISEMEGPRIRLWLAIRNSLYATATLGQLNEAVAVVLEERQATTLSELYHRIGLLLADAATPYIYERLGNRYRHFLIDEFQDTSLLQWQNLAPLVDNGLSGGFESLLVGDAKQAIYRWRSGEAGQFVALPDPYGNQMAYPSFYNAFELRDLKDNYRSGEEIIRFNNAFFRHWAALLPAELHAYYESLEQNPQRPGGYVEVQLLEEVKKKTDRITLLYEAMLPQIREMLKRGYAPGDMAILVRSNKTGSEIAAELLREGLPVISADSLLLGSHREVHQLAQFIRWLYTGDVLAEASVKIWLNTQHGWPGDRLEDKIKSQLPDWRPEIWLALNLYELGELLMNFFGLNHKADPFLWRLLDQLHDFSRQPHATTDAWLQWWEDKGQTMAVSLPEGTNAIQVMTYHKAKGLEFPVVFLPEPDVHQPAKPGVDGSWIQPPEETGLAVAYTQTGSLRDTPPEYAILYEQEKQKSQLDLINLVYVACTRASEALFVFGIKHNKEKPALTLNFSRIFGSFTGGDMSESSIHHYGNLPAKVVSGFESQAAAETGSHPYALWRENLRLSTRYRGAVTTQDSPALRRGRLAHQLLAKLDYPYQLPALLLEETESGRLSAEEAAQLQQALEKLLQDTTLAPFFEPEGQVLNEAAILGPGTHLRPDRVVLVGREARVLEYKTGLPVPEHGQQLNGYLEQLRQMGYDAVGKLVYLDLQPDQTS